MLENDSTKNGKITYVTDLAELDSLIKLHTENSYDRRSREIFNWQYFSEINPNSFILLAKVDNSLKGSYGKIFYPLIMNGQILNSHKGEAVLISPDAREQIDILKFYKNVIQACKEKGSDFSWGITSSFPLIRLVYRQKTAFLPIINYIFPTKPGSAFFLAKKSQRVSLLKKILAVVFSPVFYIYSQARFFFSSNKSLGTDFEVNLNEKKSGDLDLFMNKISKLYPDIIFLLPSKEFLHWRVDNHPLFATKKLFLYHNGLLVAFALLTFRDSDLEISEVIAENTTSYKQILSQIIKLKSGSIKNILIMGNIYNELFQEYSKVLESSGFLSNRGKSEFVFKCINPDKKNIDLGIRSWFLSNIWNEGI